MVEQSWSRDWRFWERLIECEGGGLDGECILNGVNVYICRHDTINYKPIDIASKKNVQ